jgi:pimeloyl-ACP methyl ester carboxylesterase
MARVLGVYLLLCVLARLGYRLLLYPAPHESDRPVPAGAVLRELRAADGVPVHVLEFPNSSARRTVVYFHGNGETIDDEAWFAQDLVRHGFAVTLVEYRGYGRSTRSSDAKPTEAGLYADADAALADLAARGIGADRILLWGISLGTGVATEMARHGRGAALVLVAPYTSIVDMAARLAPFLPVRFLITDRFDNLAKAPSLAVPAVVVHGTDDEVIPHAMGERVAAAIPGARLELVPGGHHMNCFAVDRGLLGRVVAELGR